MRILAPLALLLASPIALAAEPFHGAPAYTERQANPEKGEAAAKAGAVLFAANCSSCHGVVGEGTANIPSLKDGPAQKARDGELFWFITQGSADNGMPSWAPLPERDRWKLIAFIRTMPGLTPPALTQSQTGIGAAGLDAPPPKAPFTDFRYEAPGVSRKVTLADLPKPYDTDSAGNGPKIVARPANAWPKAPPGFKVELYASGLTNPRIIKTAPNGDFFVAESMMNRIRVYRGITADGKPQSSEIFAENLNRPFGLAFYPAGSADPQWLYVGDTDAIVKIPYKSGDMKARAAAQQVVELPTHGGHWTRNVEFTLDGKKMLVAVGSGSNINDPDVTPDELNRADVLEFDPDGKSQRIFAAGIRNCVGMAIHPTSGELWCSVNERDGLGDNLVPDYITHVQPGGFYGWPWFYMGGSQDPRHQGKHPELKDKVITPDVILQPHNASLGITFYQGRQFPADYQGDLFGAEHGSWNKSVRVGYEVIRVPMHKGAKASGDYEDFLTGFVIDNKTVWGRPVGLTVAPDGSLLVTDDGSGSIWRVSYTGS
jgi:glucose/arabinose dehydrogenase/cytochrome c553